MLEYRCTINGIGYAAGSIKHIRRTARLFDRPGVGNVCMATADLRILPGGEEIPPFAAVSIEYREEGSAAWLPKGTYNVNGRRQQGEFLTLRLVDAIVKTEPVYKDVTAFTTWPQTDLAVVQEIAQEIGVGIEADTAAMLGHYSVPMPQDWTMREVLGYIAASYASNLIVTQANDLRLVPFAADLQLLSDSTPRALVFNSLAIWLPDAGSAGGAQNARNLRRSVDRFEDLGRSPAYTGVELWATDEQLYSAGTETGAVLSVDCPWANQTMAAAILALVEGYHYRAFEADRALLPPETEPGALAIIDGVAVVLSCISATCAALYRADLSSPAEEEAEGEYPFKTSTERELHRRVKLGQAYHGVKTSRELGLQVLRYDGSGNETGDAVTLNTATFLVKNAQGVAILDIDFVNQTFRWNGDIVIQNGSISWGKLDSTVTSPISGNAANIANLVNGQYSGGTFIDGKKIYVPELVSPVIRGNQILAYGHFGVYDSAGQDLAGYVGRGYGSDGVATTKGVVLCTDHPDNLSAADNYVIVTNAGVRLQANGHQLYVIGRGAFVDGEKIVLESDITALRSELQTLWEAYTDAACAALETSLKQYTDDAIDAALSPLNGS